MHLNAIKRANTKKGKEATINPKSRALHQHHDPLGAQKKAELWVQNKKRNTDKLAKGRNRGESGSGWQKK